jgi:hypothetical protein
MDKRRVEHQVKYLGLSENVKVRRAGFAYRTEYSRLLIILLWLVIVARVLLGFVFVLGS